MVLVTKSQSQSIQAAQPQPQFQSTSPSTSSSKRRSIFGGLARRRQSTDDSADSSSRRNSNSSESRQSQSTPRVASPPPLPSTSTSSTSFSTSIDQNHNQGQSDQWPGGLQCLDDCVNRTAATNAKGDHRQRVDRQQQQSSPSHIYGRDMAVAVGMGIGTGMSTGMVGAPTSTSTSTSYSGQPQPQAHQTDDHDQSTVAPVSNSKMNPNPNQDGTPPTFASEEWDSMQYVLDRVQDGSMIDSTDSSPNQQHHPARFEQQPANHTHVYNNTSPSERQTFPALGRVSLDLLVHDPSSTKPFAGIELRQRQDSAPQLASSNSHSRHRSHFSIPDVVVTAAEEEGQSQHFEVKVPAAKRRSFILNVHNPQIHTMPTYNKNSNSNGNGYGGIGGMGAAAAATTAGFSKKIKGSNKSKPQPLIRLDSPDNLRGPSYSNAFSDHPKNSSLVQEFHNDNSISGGTENGSSSKKGNTISSAKKGKKTFSLFSKKPSSGSSSPFASPSPSQDQHQHQQSQKPHSTDASSSSTISNANVNVGGSFYSSQGLDSSDGSLPTCSSTSTSEGGGADSSKESLSLSLNSGMRISGIAASGASANAGAGGHVNISPPTSTSEDGDAEFASGAGGSGGAGEVKENNGGGFGSLNRSVPNFNIPSSRIADPTSAPSPSSSPTPSAASSSIRKLTKKEQKMREKQELELIKQVEKIDKMVRQHDEKEKKRERKQKERETEREKERSKRRKDPRLEMDSGGEGQIHLQALIDSPAGDNFNANGGNAPSLSNNQKPKSKLRRLTIFSAKSKAGSVAANQHAQMAAMERRNSARRMKDRDDGNRNPNLRDQSQHHLHHQQQLSNSTTFDLPTHPTPPNHSQSIGTSNSNSYTSSPPPTSTTNHQRPPRNRPPMSQPLNTGEVSSGQGVQSRPRPPHTSTAPSTSVPPPPTIVLTSPSSPVRTSFSDAYPQPKNLSYGNSSSSHDQIKDKDASADAVASGVRSSQEWQDLSSPTSSGFPQDVGISMSPDVSKTQKSEDEHGFVIGVGDHVDPQQQVNLSRSTSLQRALAYTHAEEGMIRKRASLRRRGSKRSVGGGNSNGNGTGSARSSIVDSHGVNSTRKRPGFLRKNTNGSLHQVEDPEWEEEEDQEEEEGEGRGKRDGKGNAMGARTGMGVGIGSSAFDRSKLEDGAITPRAANNGDSSPQQSVTPQAVSFSRPFSRPPPSLQSQAPAQVQPESPSKPKLSTSAQSNDQNSNANTSSNANMNDPFTDAMAHIISAASPPLEAAKVITNPIKFNAKERQRGGDRNGSVSSNSTGSSAGSGSGSGSAGAGSPKKYRNLIDRKDDHFVFPIVRPVRSSTLDNPITLSSQDQAGHQTNQNQGHKDRIGNANGSGGRSPLPRSSSTPQYF